MDIQQIKSLANRQPFRQFVIALNNGEQIEVTSDTELLFPRKQPNLVIIFTSANSWMFEAEAVSALGL